MSVPPLGELNGSILAEAQRVTDGAYRFTPGPSASPTDNPRDAEHDGTGEDLVAAGRVFARGAADGATYCCGFVLAVTFRAWRRWSAEQGEAMLWNLLDPPALDALVVDWFCPTVGHGGVVDALVARGWGLEVSAETAVAGDLIQFWRSHEPPSGHQAVLIGLARNEEGDTVVTYHSSQRATGGPGETSEVLGPDWEMRIVRVGG